MLTIKTHAWDQLLTKGFTTCLQALMFPPSRLCSMTTSTLQALLNSKCSSGSLKMAKCIWILSTPPKRRSQSTDIESHKSCQKTSMWAVLSWERLALSTIRTTFGTWMAADIKSQSGNLKKSSLLTSLSTEWLTFHTSNLARQASYHQMPLGYTHSQTMLRCLITHHLEVILARQNLSPLMTLEVAENNLREII